jgi:hypothetical protein
METLDRLIDSYRKDVDWYKNELRFMDTPEEKAVYAECRAVCMKVIRDLEQLKKELDADTPDTP